MNTYLNIKDLIYYLLYICISDDKGTKTQSNSNQAFGRNISLFSPIASEKKNSETVQKSTLENLEQVIASSSSNLSLEQETFERY